MHVPLSSDLEHLTLKLAVALSSVTVLLPLSFALTALRVDWIQRVYKVLPNIITFYLQAHLAYLLELAISRKIFFSNITYKMLFVNR